MRDLGDISKKAQDDKISGEKRKRLKAAGRERNWPLERLRPSPLQ